MAAPIKYKAHFDAPTKRMFVSANGRLFAWGRRDNESPLSDGLYFIRILAEFINDHGKHWEPSASPITGLPERAKLVVTVYLPSPAESKP